MSKGSRQRSYNLKNFNDNYDKIFRDSGQNPKAHRHNKTSIKDLVKNIKIEIDKIKTDKN